MSRVTVGNEHHVEEGGVEYNVTMVGDERITSRLLRIDALQITIIEGAAVGVLADDVPDDGFHKPQLEVERCLDLISSNSFVVIITINYPL